MSPPASAKSLLGRVGVGCSIATALYALLLGILLTPQAQRFAIYAHKINTLFLGDDLADPEAFGFLPNQVTPFTLTTPDGETLYAWHVLPLDLYTRHEKHLRLEPRAPGPVPDLTQTSAFRLLTATDPDPPRLIISFHGNAGHIAQGWRPDTYRHLVTQPNTHLLTLDYRGFGHSTGSPTEPGLITDALALVHWALHVAHIPPDRIVLLGQSLGTAVASAVALHFADPGHELIPSETRELYSGCAPGDSSRVPNEADAAAENVLAGDPLTPTTITPTTPTTFTSIILIAPFTSLPSLLLSYRLGGLVPLLLPLRPFPRLARSLTTHVRDTWRTADRLAAYHRALQLHNHNHSSGSSSSSTGPQTTQKGSGSGSGSGRGSLQLLHSSRDRDIPSHETAMICRRIFPGPGPEPQGPGGVGVADDNDEGRAAAEDDEVVRCLDARAGAAVQEVQVEGGPRVRFEIVPFGGHNRIVTYAAVGAAVLRAFEDCFDQEGLVE